MKPRPATARSVQSSSWVSPTVANGAAVCGRLLIIGLAFYALVLVLSRFALVVIPVFGALFTSALLHVPVARLRRRGWPRAAATWLVLVAALVVLGAVGFFIISQVSGQYPQLVTQVADVRDHLQQLLTKIPGFSSIHNMSDLGNRLVAWLQQNRAAVAGGVLTAGQLAGEIVTGVIITIFVSYFFLAEGDRIWSWLVRLLPIRMQPGINGAGVRAFSVVSGWVVGTALIACIHAVVIGAVLWLVGASLVLPLAVLVFIGSFVPIIGAVLAGGVAIVVTLVTAGPVPALILLVVLIAENQIEAHLLQPFIVGRAVRLHPVAIVLVLAAAAAVGGLLGAIVAVPLVAALHAGIKYLTGVEDLHGNPLDGRDRMAPMPVPLVNPSRPSGSRVDGRR
jgi:predicted PurR-regulated permease PerM